jgi:uncharacterized protein (TIGR03435 family)
MNAGVCSTLMRSLHFLTIILALLTSFAGAQSVQKPQFDAATLKAVAVDPAETYTANLGTIRNGRMTLTNVTLSDCIRFAYDIVSESQIVGADWIKSRDVRFDIVGQAAAETPDAEMRKMLQTLLAERLNLGLHHEQRELPYLALVIGRNGHKLRPAREGDSTPPITGAGRIIHPRMPMSVLAMLLSRFERQIVVDLTALAGPFDVKLEWTPDFIRERARPDGGAVSINGQSFDPNGPTLYTAIQDQLGLRLESRKGPLDVIVVDHAEKVPAEN